MRYNGPLGKGFSGDRQRAMPLQGVARNLVGQLIAKIKAPPFNGSGMQFGKTRLPDGSVINAMVQMIGAHPIIRTWVESPEQVGETIIQPREITPLALDAGYLNVDDLSSPISWGFVHDDEYADYLGMLGCDAVSETYYNPHTTKPLPWLYALTDKKEEFVIDKQPKSFWVDAEGTVSSCASTKMTAVLGNAALLKTATGKMRLYQQAKLGSIVKDATECQFGTRFIPSINSGIITDTTGRYWVAVVVAQEESPRVDFYSLTISDELLADVSGSETQRQLLEAESKAFAASVASASPVYSMSIMDGDSVWVYPGFPSPAYDIPRPMAHGWKFSWDTNEASIVILHCLRRAGTESFFHWRADIRSLTYRINFSYEEVIVVGETVHRFVPRVTLVESHDFFYSNKWGWWFPLIGEETTAPWAISDCEIGTTTFSEPSDIPVYGYYVVDQNDATDQMGVKNNLWKPVKITYQTLQNGPATETGSLPNGYGFDEGAQSPIFENWERNENIEILRQVSFDDTDVAGNSYGNTYFVTLENISVAGRWVRSYETDTPHRPSVPTYVQTYDGDAYATVGTETYSIPTLKDLGYCPPSYHPDYDPEISPPGPQYAVVSYDTSLYLFSGGWTKKEGSRSSAEKNRVPCFGILLSDAESVVLIDREYRSEQYSSTNLSYSEDTWAARLDEFYVAPPLANAPYPCGTNPDWGNPTALGITGCVGHIYDVRRTASGVVSFENIVIDGTVSILGKSGSQYPISLRYSASRSSQPTSSTGSRCVLETPLTYLTVYRSLIDPEWSYGMRLVQGIGAAKKLKTYCDEFADQSAFTYAPSKKEWLRETAVAGGYPQDLADDDFTIPIGWA